MSSDASSQLSVTPIVEPRSPMLSSLDHDSGSRFCVFVMLQLADLATLARCCHQLQSWLHRDNAIDKRRIQLEPRKLPSLFDRWICKHIGGMVLSPYGEVRCAVPALEEFQRRGHVQFTALHHLSVALGRTVHAAMAQCITALGPRLQSLSISVHLTAAADLAQVLDSAGACIQLAEFVLCGEFQHRHPPLIDLAPLAKLPLRTLNIRQSKDARWSPSESQVKVIVALAKTLSKLNAGSWNTAMLAEFVKAKQASSVPLTRFQLNHSVIDPSFWVQLCQLPTLQLLFPGRWSPLSPQEWLHLPRFRNLQSLFIGGVQHQTDLRTEQFLPALLQCRAITWLKLGAGLSISSAQLKSIVETLTRLNRLVLQDLAIETVEALAGGADHLVHLELLRLRTLSHSPLQSARESLPSLPRLTFLRIFDADRLTEEEVKSVNTRLLARQPLLMPNCFEQNLRQLWM